MDIAFAYVHMVEKHLAQAGQGRRAFVSKRKEFAYVEYSHTVHRQFTALVHGYQAGIYRMCGAAGA